MVTLTIDGHAVTVPEALLKIMFAPSFMLREITVASPCFHNPNTLKASKETERGLN